MRISISATITLLTSRSRSLPGVWSVAAAKKSKGVVKKNSGASLVDLGDGVGCIEFHSKMNTLGSDIVQFVSQTLKPGGAGDKFEAFVIANDAANFSVGANLMLLLMSAQEEEWDEVDLAIRAFQGGMTQGNQVLAEIACGCGSIRHDAGRRRGNVAACGRAPAARGTLYGPG